MSIFAPSPPGGSAQGFLPPDGRPCGAEKSPHVTPLPPESVSGLGDAAAGAGNGPTARSDPTRSGGAGTVAPLPAPRKRAASAGAQPPAGARTPMGWAGQSQRPPAPASSAARPRPPPPPGPAPAPHRRAAVPSRAAPAVWGEEAARLPPPPAPPRRRRRRPATHPRRGGGGGGEEEEQRRPAGSGRGCALPGSPPGGRRGGCRRPSVTARRVPRPRGIAGAAAAGEGRGAHVGPAPRSPTLSGRRPAAQGPTARCGARQHAALAGLGAAAERRAQRRVCRGEYAGGGSPGLRGGVPGRDPLPGRRGDGTGCRRGAAQRGPVPARLPPARIARGLRLWGRRSGQVGLAGMPGLPRRAAPARSGAAGTARGAPASPRAGGGVRASPAGRAPPPSRSPTARWGAPRAGEGM